MFEALGNPYVQLAFAVVIGSFLLALLTSIVIAVINRAKSKEMKKKVDEGLKKIRQKEKDDGLV